MDSLQLPPDFKELLSLLNKYGVEYLLTYGRPKDLADLSYLP